MRLWGCWRPFGRGLIFRSENYIYPPPLLKMILFPPLVKKYFLLLLCPFCNNSALFCIYFTLYFPTSKFSVSFPFLPFTPIFPLSFPFLPFSLTVSRVFPFHFLLNDISWHSPPPGRGCKNVGNLERERETILKVPKIILEGAALGTFLPWKISCPSHAIKMSAVAHFCREFSSSAWCWKIRHKQLPANRKQ